MSLRLGVSSKITTGLDEAARQSGSVWGLLVEAHSQLQKHCSTRTASAPRSDDRAGQVLRGPFVNTAMLSVPFTITQWTTLKAHRCRLNRFLKGQVAVADESASAKDERRNKCDHKTRCSDGRIFRLSNTCWLNYLRNGVQGDALSTPYFPSTRGLDDGNWSLWCKGTTTLLTPCRPEVHRVSPIYPSTLWFRSYSSIRGKINAHIINLHLWIKEMYSADLIIE